MRRLDIVALGASPTLLELAIPESPVAAAVGEEVPLEVSVRSAEECSVSDIELAVTTSSASVVVRPDEPLRLDSVGPDGRIGRIGVTPQDAGRFQLLIEADGRSQDAVTATVDLLAEPRSQAGRGWLALAGVALLVIGLITLGGEMVRRRRSVDGEY